ncbi:MAG: isochorismatase family protein [Pyrinomonadaceae bacterium]
MSHDNILDASKTAVVVVDVQEAFRKAIGDFSLVASNISRAVRGCNLLGLRVFVTEQYPAGLGKTAEEVVLALSERSVTFEKTAFSAYQADGFAEELGSHGLSQVLLCGFETHVCVNQTAHDLLDSGLQVHLLLDCVASRFEYDRRAGIEKMSNSGVIASSVETAFFELMKDSRHPRFKDIQALIK